jgi:hypothetical protein
VLDPKCIFRCNVQTDVHRRPCVLVHLHKAHCGAESQRYRHVALHHGGASYMLYGCQRPMHGPGGDGHSIMGVEPGHHQSTTPGCPTRYTPPTHSDRRVSDSDAPFRLVRSCKREERIAAHSPDTGGLVMSARTRDCNSPGRALLLR